MEAFPVSYRLIRSRRKSVAVEIRDGEVTVRAPLRYPEEELQRLLWQRKEWISRKVKLQQRQLESASAEGLLTDRDIAELTRQAQEELPPLVAKWASVMGVTYGRVTVRCQRTRWGSCSASGNLSFNCLLMLCPEHVREGVVIHELCHRLEMNHSASFYRKLSHFFPTWKACIAWLKENGSVLLKRAMR